jgi:hypothetical protein
MLRSIVLYTTVMFLILGSISCTRRAKTPALNTPDELIKDLAAAANKGDADAFLSAMSDKSRKALEESFADRAALQDAEDHFQQTLNKRFGKADLTSTIAPADFKSMLRRLKGMEILSSNPLRDGSMELRVRSTIETAAGTVSQEDTLLARQEAGTWKLAGSNFAPEGPDPALTERYRSRKSTLDDLTKQVRDGQFKDRESALSALAGALSGPPREAGPGKPDGVPPEKRPNVRTAGFGANESPAAVQRTTPAPADATITIRGRQPAKNSEKEK